MIKGRTYAFLNGDEEGEVEIVPIGEDTFDRIGWENLFHSLPQEQLEVLVCLYLGMKPLEIVKALGYENIGRYYNVSFKLRQMYRERKDRFVEYNDKQL